MRQSKDLLDVSPEALPRPRWRRRWIGVLLAAVLCFLAPMAYYAWHSSRQLEEALREADRLDPGWRLEELEASRAAVADDQNSALVLLRAHGLLPRNWPWDRSPDKLSAKEMEVAKKVPWELVPPVLLRKEEQRILLEELQKASAALSEVHKIVELPHGRYPILYTKDGVSTSLDHTQNTRAFATLLSFEAVLRAHQHDLEGALADCLGILRVGQSIGDEPSLISMLIRISHHRVAFVSLEYILAQGQFADAALANLQHVLEKEEKERWWLGAARGERAVVDEAMRAIQNGDVKLSQVSALVREFDGQLFPTYSAEALPGILMPGSLRRQRAALLKWHNRMVEIAKLPVEELTGPLTELDSSAKDLPPLARALCVPCVKCAEPWLRDQVSMRCMITLLAVERYRLAHGRWPEKLADLVPAYLSKVPIDVYDRAPLRYRAFSEGVMVYSVGMDGIDDGGNLERIHPKLPGTDWGYRLWAVKHRRRLAVH
jgi:hypothetical protein